MDEKLYTKEEVCQMIDDFPGVNPEVARCLKAEMMKDIIHHAVKVSLKLEKVVRYRRVE